MVTPLTETEVIVCHPSRKVFVIFPYSDEKWVI